MSFEDIQSSKYLPSLCLQQSSTRIFDETKTIDPIKMSLLIPSISHSACTPITPGFDDYHAQNSNRSVKLQIENKKTDISATLKQHGYNKRAIICHNSLQGQVFLAEKTQKTKTKRFAIKIVNKNLHAESIAMEDDMSFIVEEDIIKESAILNILTSINRPPGDYIATFIEFFEDESNYYLVTEYCGKSTLLKFVNKAHELLKHKKLDLKKYQKTVKYLFWQICVIFNWLHNDMNCCHLDLCMSNLLIKNGNFIENEDGMYTVNPKICIKIIDFGCGEIFENLHNKNWNCGKTTLTGNYIYCAPQVYENILYDARKADIYQLGCILYYMCAGIPAYQYQDSTLDKAFLCIERNDIRAFLKHHNLLHFVNKKIITLLNGMLHTNEKQRVNIKQILEHDWFKAYFERYKNRIDMASKQQKKANKSNLIVMNNFPYYTIESNY